MELKLKFFGFRDRVPKQLYECWWLWRSWKRTVWAVKEFITWSMFKKSISTCSVHVIYPFYTGRFKPVRNRFQLLSSWIEVSVNTPKLILKPLESDLNRFLYTTLGGGSKRFLNWLASCINAPCLKTVLNLLHTTSPPLPPFLVLMSRSLPIRNQLYNYTAVLK